MFHNLQCVTVGLGQESNLEGARPGSTVAGLLGSVLQLHPGFSHDAARASPFFFFF